MFGWTGNCFIVSTLGLPIIVDVNTVNAAQRANAPGYLVDARAPAVGAPAVEQKYICCPTCLNRGCRSYPSQKTYSEYTPNSARQNSRACVANLA